MMGLTKLLSLSLSLLAQCRTSCTVNAFSGPGRFQLLERQSRTQKVAMFQSKDGGEFDEEMAARMMELEAMGGDPFFAMDDESDDDETASSAEEDINDLQMSTAFMAKMAAAGGGAESILNVVQERYATDGLGPSPKFKQAEVEDDPDWEWDGFVDENAHLD